MSRTGLLSLAIAAAWAGLTPQPAAAQYELTDEPILASAISDQNIEIRGRYVQQWKEDDGTLVLVMTGGFRLEFGARRLTAREAVAWITPHREEPDGRKHYELVVYLSGDAEVTEPGGTVTTDDVLLVRGLRTYGQVIKYQDAHQPGTAADSPLYQQARRDRTAIETGQWPTAAAPQVVHPGMPPGEPGAPVAAKPGEPGPPPRPRTIRYRVQGIEPATTAAGEQVFVMLGRVYLSQDGGPDAPLLEIRADNAVVFPAEGAAAGFMESTLEGAAPGREAAETAPSEPPDTGQRPVPQERAPDSDQRAVPPDGAREPGERQAGLMGLEPGMAARNVRGVYLEGDVVLSLGTRFVRAHRLYYDFEHQRALLLDAVFRADVPQRGIPLYVRADEIRQLSQREFEAERAVVTTSEFYTPSYHIGADRVVIRDVTPRDAEGQATGPVTGEYEMENATLNVGGQPLLWWPHSEGRLSESETLLRRIRLGYSGDFGAELETSWYLFNLLGVPAPEGYDATLRLDYFSERGPGVGVNLDYERETHYGLFRGYFIHDDGEDNLGDLRAAQEDPSTSERGRVLWRHRHYLPNDWEATLELAYISDPHFMEEYEKDEWFEGKDQETVLYLKRARDTEAITLLANWRLLDFVTQTEHLPDLTYRRIGDLWLDPVVLYHESRIGAVRYRPEDIGANGLPFFLYENQYTGLPGRRGRATDLTVRGDLRQEAEWPVKLGPVSLVPFASVRGSGWDGQPTDDGSLWRGLGVYGVRGGTSFARTFDDVESELFDVHRIRHIVKPEVVAWGGHSNVRSEELTPFDYGIETIDGFYGTMLGVRQTWQTQRGPAAARRTVDLLKFDLELGLFGNNDDRNDISNGWVNPWRPENSRTRNYLAGDIVWRLSDSTSLLYNANFDLNDGSFDRNAIALAVERNPRLAYVLGARYAGDIDMSLVGGGWNYKLNEKHLTAVRAWYDVDQGDLGEFTLAYIRRLPRWFAGITFEYDNVEDDYSINFSLWPEGVPEWAMGSRRFTDLGYSTGIRP